jgi:hypothetical protein
MVRVYSGMAVRTIRFTITLFVPEGSVPVTVTVYSVAGVVLLVVMVRLGLAGVVTEAGLMTQVGVPVVCSGVTWQLRSTLTALTELRALTLMVEVAACPPGKTAAGDTGEATRAKSCCAKAADTSVKVTMDNNAIEISGRRGWRDFNMRKFGFS